MYATILQIVLLSSLVFLNVADRRPAAPGLTLDTGEKNYYIGSHFKVKVSFHLKCLYGLICCNNVIIAKFLGKFFRSSRILSLSRYEISYD